MLPRACARAHDVTARMRRDDDVIRRARARLMTSSKMAAPIKHVHARAHGRRHLDDVIAGSTNHSRPSDDVIAAILEHVTSRGRSPPITRVAPALPLPLPVTWIPLMILLTSPGRQVSCTSLRVCGHVYGD